MMRLPTLLAAACVALVAACTAPSAESPGRDSMAIELDEATEAFLDSLERRTFHYFWDLSHPETGMSPDRWPTQSFSSIAATGFALTAYPIGAERGWISRAQARERVQLTLEFFWSGPQHDGATGAMGHRGFFYHFVDHATGERFETVELSTIDTALLLAGVLFCQSYFDGPEEGQIRALAESLYIRVDWAWAQPRAPGISLGWKPESGFLPYDWRGYNETMIMMILALGSPTHPVDRSAWEFWTDGYRWGSDHGIEYLGFAPLFGHQYSHVWIDYRGVKDDWSKEKGIDYFENSRRATLAQRAYAIENPNGWKGYGENLWGLTACDGPVSGTFTLHGRERQFNTYWARGASLDDVRDDGTIAPTAAGGSIAFAPEVVIPALKTMYAEYGEHLYSTYGFLDSFNPTLDVEIPVQHGYVVPGVGWFNGDWLGIDQGPIVCMIENYRSGLVWDVMRRNPHVRRGMQAAGFTGGWLEERNE